MNHTSSIEQVLAVLKLLNIQQFKIDFDPAALIFKSQNGLAPKYIILAISQNSHYSDCSNSP